MRFFETTLKGSYVIEPEPTNDSRGWFARYFCKNEFEQIGHSKEWLQLNHSYTHTKGTIRGMHYQFPPFSEIKLVRCISGSVFDVIVDLREKSDTFLKWFGLEMSAQNKKMIYIPEGFAHGFQVLEDNSELLYHHTEFYTPSCEAGINLADKTIGINWPMKITACSERDSNFPGINSDFKGL